MIRSCHPYKTEKSRLGAVTASGWLFFVHLIYMQEQVVLYSDMLNVLHFSHSLCRNGLSRGNVSMYATFLLSENGVMMLLIKQKPLQAQRLYCLSNYRLPLCSVGAGQQTLSRRNSPRKNAFLRRSSISKTYNFQNQSQEDICSQTLSTFRRPDGADILPLTVTGFS